MNVEDKRTNEMKEMDEITDHFINLIESNDVRYSFDTGSRGKIYIRDKEKNCTYVITINKLENEKDKVDDIANMIIRGFKSLDREEGCE